MSDKPPRESPSGEETAVETLGQVAVRMGLVTDQQVNEAAATQSEYAQAGLRKKIGEVMLEKHFINPEQLDLLVKNQHVASKRIGDYELISKLGEGGMGAVFRARQLSMDRDVAVKVLSPRNAGNPEFRERFEREAKAIARLNHPHIVTGIDAGHADGYYYFAMEFVDGETLGQYLRRRGGRLDEREALTLVRQVVLALKHAHENNILHRDVKPDNILYDKNRGVAKLADLGLAREAVSEDSGGTRVGQAVGTPFYMAPEQARGKTMSAATDLYSLGGTLYHLLTGEIPFPGPTAAVIMARHITDAPPDPRAIEPRISPATAHMIMKCLQKNPEDRFANAEELLKEIDSILEGRRADSTPPMAKTRSQMNRPVRDSSRTEDAVAVQPSRRKRVRRRREDSSSSSMIVVIVVVGLLALALIYGVVSSRKKDAKKNVPAGTVK